MNSHSLNNQIVAGGSGAIGAAALAVVAHLNYSTGCVITIAGGRPLA